jgi:hypothetical protein
VVVRHRTRAEGKLSQAAAMAARWSLVRSQGAGARMGKVVAFIGGACHAVKQQGARGDRTRGGLQDGERQSARTGVGARVRSHTRRARAPKVLRPCATSGRSASGRAASKCVAGGA